MDTRAWFTQAADGFRTLLPGLDGQLDKPGLGDWDVRSLLGHTCRAFTTIETYLNTPDTSAEVEIDSPEEYFRAAAAQLADPEKVTRRGREAGTALGQHPLTSAAETAERVESLVRQTLDDALVGTPVGVMRFVDYLSTRAFELTVHGLDLAGASGQETPDSLTRCAPEAVALCAQIATPAQAVQLLRAATGREILPGSFTTL